MNNLEAIISKGRHSIPTKVEEEHDGKMYWFLLGRGNRGGSLSVVNGMVHVSRPNKKELAKLTADVTDFETQFPNLCEQ